MLEKHQWPTCTDTPSTYTGTPMQKSISGQPVPVHLQLVPVHPCRKVVESNLYRYTHVRFTGIEQEYDSNARARSSFSYQLEITMEKGIKAKGKGEKASLDS